MSEPAKVTYEWKQIPWRKHQVSVFKLQKRIYRASQAGDVKKVHNLQRLLLASRAARYIAVRQVTQDNQGKKTAGVDGVASLTPKQRLAMVEKLGHLRADVPLRRVWIPKPGKDEKRPLGIPTLYVRATQALGKLALEPEWEAKFEPNSYGFRPGRGAHDAIGAIFIALRRHSKYVLDADIAKCFDRIDHQALLEKLATFPRLRRLIRQWLKAGVLDNGVFKPTEAGTPQGGVISPLLMNVALHGLEEYICSHFPARIRQIQPSGHRTERCWKPQVIRYADDFVILHPDKSVIERCQELVEEWLAEMGLELSKAKTRIGHTLEEEGGRAGFDFLGFEVRQHRVSRRNSARGHKTLIKPSKEARKRHYRELSERIDRNRAAKQENLIGLLNPKTVGWSNYYRTVVSQEVFNRLDYQLKDKLARWARSRHPTKSRRWVVSRYWIIEPGGRVFGVPDKVTLKLHGQTPIVRHVKVKGAVSPFNGDWTYWAARQGKFPGISKRLAGLLKRQEGRCGKCGLFFEPDALMETHHRDGNSKDNRRSNLLVVHRHCHDRIHGERGRLTA